MPSARTSPPSPPGGPRPRRYLRHHRLPGRPGGAATGMVLTPSGEVLDEQPRHRAPPPSASTDIGNGKTYAAHVVGYDRSTRRGTSTADQCQRSCKRDSRRFVDAGPSGLAVTAVGNAGGAAGRRAWPAARSPPCNQSITASDAGSGASQRLNGLIETDAAIQPGDSGGPLLDGTGKVIGMEAATSVGFSFHRRPAS